MDNSPQDRNTVETLAADFADRIRRGEEPSASEYVLKRPDLEAEILDLFPTIAALENLGLAKERGPSGPASLGPSKLEQLGDYRLLREIGRGGMGVVYEAEQQSLSRRVAIKVLPKHAVHDRKRFKRFQREARTAAQLHHTNIVPVFGVGQHDDTHYFVMQLIPGVGLERIIAHQHIENGSDAIPDSAGQLSTSSPTQNVETLARTLIDDYDSRRSDESNDSAGASRVRIEVGSRSGYHRAGTEGETIIVSKDSTDVERAPGDANGPDVQNVPHRSNRYSSYWQSVARVGHQVADALAYAHSLGTLHRDIKPANLLVDDKGRVWVTDFGLARAIDDADVSRTGDVVGTLRYMAPEQLRGETDVRSDIFSLGLTLYELTTLRPGFDEQQRRQALLGSTRRLDPIRPRKICRDIPRDLETILVKCLEYDPRHRYPSAQSLADDLDNFLDDRPIAARRASIAERAWRWCRRNPALAGPPCCWSPSP